MMMDLETFFKEKNIPLTVWEIKHNGETHFINSEYIIEAIFATQGNERVKIAGTLFVLDTLGVKNFSIMDYLHYLAQDLVQQHPLSPLNRKPPQGNIWNK